MTCTTLHPAAEPLNAISVDVEDWPQAVVDPTLPLTDRFCPNTRRVLEALARHDVHATFFVLGLAAERAPDLVREIVAAGHEVQSHGHGHVLLHRLTPAAFRADLDRSRKLLEDLTGHAIVGYRAPAFSIVQDTLWALDVLAEAGFQYDSSIFPVCTRRYGISWIPPHPHALKTPAGHELIEFPVASYQFAGRRVPVGGGGYFRLFPYFVLQRGLRQLNAAGHSATIYVHPHEFSPGDFDALGRPVSWKLRLHQGLWRRYVPRRLDRLLREFRFGRIADVLATTRGWPHAACPPETA